MEYPQKIMDFYTGACITLLINIGYKTGLLEAIQKESLTSEQLANKLQLQERYVREWLAGMYCGGLIDFNPSDNTFLLHSGYSLYLTGNSSNNMAPLSQLIELLSSAIPKVVHCFKYGGGVPYSEYPGFAKIESEVTKSRYEDKIFSDYLPLLPKDIQEKLNHGNATVLDIGCGTGHCCNMMAKHFPKTNLFYGVDLDEQAIHLANQESQKLELSNSKFFCMDVTKESENSFLKEKKFDLILSFMVIHDLSYPSVALKFIYNYLKKDGYFFMQETNSSDNLIENKNLPRSCFYYTASLLHCMTQSLSNDGGEGLGTMPSSKKIIELLKQAGFSDIKTAIATIEPYKLFYIAKKK
jgi:2-polyprenyl-3-methyl-5-hydroxy-6-metoxy-1,4-benzoquinol methylase